MVKFEETEGLESKFLACSDSNAATALLKDPGVSRYHAVS